MNFAPMAKPLSSPAPQPLRWNPTLEKLPALSIRQPYAWLIANGIKDIENRSRRTLYRGPVLIHAGLSREELAGDFTERLDPTSSVSWAQTYDFGGIVGVAEIVDCVRKSGSPWKHPASWGWMLTNARPLRFRPCKGALGFFKCRFIK
jgi:hypothetical protein